jgi:trehalose/maltose transport system substrate-binding protein
MHGIHRPIFRRAWLALIALMLAGIGGCHREVEQPVTVRLLHYGWLPPYDLPAASGLSEEFERQTGIKLELVRGAPTETTDQPLLIRKLLQQRDERPDVVEADETWLGTLKDDLLDLRPYFQSEAGSIPPAIALNYIMNGKVLAMPYQNHAGVLEYRADLLREYGYDHPPRTLTELEIMALRIQTGERANGHQNFWGYIWPGAVEESLTCNALEWQVDEGGGRIIEQNSTISVNNPAAIRAWERARHWIGWISPPSVKEYRESDVQSAFRSGRSAFARVWAAEAGGLSTRERPELRTINWWNKSASGEVGFTAMPAGSKARTAALGGAGLFISKYSKHPREDAALIRFVLRKELQAYEDEKSHSSSHQLVIYDAADLDGPKSASSLADTSRAVIVARPTNVSAGHYDQVSNAYSTAVHSVLTDKKKASDAASELEEDLVRITGLRTGPPTRE